MNKVKPIPDGYHSLTPSIVVPDCKAAIDLYKKVFGARQTEMIMDGDRVIHAEVVIGNSVLMLADENDQWGLVSPATVGGNPTSLYHYVEDVDAVAASAMANGFSEMMPVADMFWGDRYGQYQDPFGHIWGLSTRLEQVEEEEIQRRADDFAG